MQLIPEWISITAIALPKYKVHFIKLKNVSQWISSSIACEPNQFSINLPPKQLIKPFNNATGTKLEVTRDVEFEHRKLSTVFFIETDKINVKLANWKWMMDTFTSSKALLAQKCSHASQPSWKWTEGSVIKNGIQNMTICFISIYYLSRAYIGQFIQNY